MCKIVLNYGELDIKTLEGHRETCERGAGIAVIRPDKTTEIIKTMKHAETFKKYGETTPGIVQLFHSRFPTRGEESELNVQPFESDKFILCHNGTVKIDDFYPAMFLLKIPIDSRKSDTHELFDLINHNGDTAQIIDLLQSYSDRFVLVEKQKKQIHIMGRFELDIIEKEKRHFVRSAKNVSPADSVYIRTEYSGRVLEYVTIDKYEKPKIHYAGYLDGYQPDEKTKDKNEKTKERKQTSTAYWSKKKLDWMIFDDQLKLTRHATFDEIDLARWGSQCGAHTDKAWLY